MSAAASQSSGTGPAKDATTKLVAFDDNAKIPEHPGGGWPVPSFANIAASAKEIAQLAPRIIAQEAMTWDVFRWVVVVLLAVNILLTLILSGGSGSETDQIRKNQEAYAAQLNDLRAEIDQKIGKAKAELSGDIAAAQAGLMDQLRKATAVTRSRAPSGPVPLPTRAPDRR